MIAIDISRYQGVVDFAAVKNSGVRLVIAKQGGADSGLYTDSKYLANRAGVRAVGLPLGSYFFNGPAATPVAAADYLWSGMDYRPGDLAIIDVEGSGIGWNPSQVLAFVQRMIGHGIPAAAVGVYLSASGVRAQDWSAVAATGAFLWVAQYGTNTGSPGSPPPVRWWSSWSLWQYTSDGSVPGIAGRVDMSSIASEWSPFLPPKPKPKVSIMSQPQRFQFGTDGGDGTLLALAGFLGAPGPGNWDEYKRNAADPHDRAVYEFNQYGVARIITDQAEWDRVKALYTTPAPVGTVDLAPDAKAALLAIPGIATSIPTASDIANALLDAEAARLKA